MQGASCPPGYSGELDEWNYLSFVRPTEWTNWKKNPLYHYLKPSKTGEFAANFSVMVSTKDELIQAYEVFGFRDLDKNNVEEIYNNISDGTLEVLKQNVHDYQSLATNKEYIEVNGVKILKVVHTYSAKFTAEG